MRTSESIDQLAAALAAAQGQMGPVSRNSTVKIKTRSGAEYSYDYSTLDNVIECTRKPLSENGIAVIQAPSFTDGGLELVTRLVHSSGQWIECALSMQPENNEIKTLGSVITYLRRYAYTAIVGVASDEDKDAPQGENIKPSQKQRQNNNGATSDQSKAVKAFYAKALTDCGLEAETVRLICKALGISFDPSKADEILKTLCREVETPSTMPSLIVAANRKTNDYYNRQDDLMANQFHIQGSVKKLHPDIVWPSKPGNPKEWAEALILAIEYAEANKPDELDKFIPRDTEQQTLVDVPETVPAQTYE